MVSTGKLSMAPEPTRPEHHHPGKDKSSHGHTIELFKIPNAITPVFGHATPVTPPDEDLMYERAAYNRKKDAQHHSVHHTQRPGPYIDEDLMYEKWAYEQKREARLETESCASSTLSFYEEYLTSNDMLTLSRGTLIRKRVAKSVKALHSYVEKVQRWNAHLRRCGR